MQRYKFAFVSNSAEVGESVRTLADPRTEEITVHLATMEDAVSVARGLLAGDVEVVIGGGGTGSLLARTIGPGVVKLERSSLQFLRALMQAREFAPRVALTDFAHPTDGIDVFRELLGLDIVPIVFSTTAELEEGIRRAISDGVTTIVGPGICQVIAGPLGGHAIVVMPDQEDVFQALREARAMAEARRLERRRGEEYRTIVETIEDGVVVFDSEGLVKLTNQAATEILGPRIAGADPRRLVGRPLPAALKDSGLAETLQSGQAELDHVVRIAGEDLVISCLPVVVDSETVAVVATIKEASRIRNIDRKVRETAYRRGFVARHTLDSLRSVSPVMARLKDKAGKYAATNANILVEGETGTGKELLAQSLHNLSPRRRRPFLAVNCSALPESLLESELFGYEEGAFTGARRGGRAGLFEMATGGTLFLDEIADIPATLQVRLLRVIEEKEIMRVGGDRIVSVDVRIISSTSRDLLTAAHHGAFRLDLYYRLETLSLRLPPLRERVDDIPVIVQAILRDLGEDDSIIGAEMLDRFRSHVWHGNVRELDALIRRFVALRDGSAGDRALLVELFDEIADHRRDGKPVTDPYTDSDDTPLKERLRTYESAIIERTLRECRYNRRETARRLGISVNSLWRKSSGRT